MFGKACYVRREIFEKQGPCVDSKFGMWKLKNGLGSFFFSVIGTILFFTSLKCISLLGLPWQITVLEL